MSYQVRTNQHAIAYSDEGTGLPIVFLHAFPLNRRMWSPQIPACQDQFRVVAVDLRGHGESDSSAAVESMDDFACDVREVLDRLRIREAVLVGLSMGGYVAFACYRRFAERIVGLVLADTRAQPDNAEARAGRMSMIQTAESKGTGAIADIMLPKLLSPASLQGKPELSQRVRMMIEQTPVGTIKADLKAMADRPDSTPLLATISCPALVLVGELDRATPPSDAQYMADRIHESHLHIVSDAAHLPNLERPEVFNTTLVSFLKAIS
jgi:pimeloyl-ACP methyl ester carboxylesterase